MQLIDSHCHIDIEEFRAEFNLIVARARQAGVQTMVMPGVDQQGWPRMMALAELDPGLLAAPGLHPLYLARHRSHHLEILADMARNQPLVAIGEIGLDYFVAGVDRNRQQELFEAQLRIAAGAGLPILLHSRKAHDQVLATLRRTKFKHGGIVHAFNGSLQQARQFGEMGFAVGLGGNLTYQRALRIRALAVELPESALVLETDAPDIPLASHRDGPNLPEYPVEVCSCLADLRGESSALVGEYTTANVRRILHLP